MTNNSYGNTLRLSLGVLFSDSLLHARVSVGAGAQTQVFLFMQQAVLSKEPSFQPLFFVIGSHVSQVGLELNI